MKYSLHPIHQIDPALIVPLARLHEASMRILLSDMGFPFILRYFQMAVQEPQVIGFYGLSDANSLIGYVVGTPKPNELNSRLTSPFLWFTAQCLRLLFTRPRVLVQAIISSRSLSRQVASEAEAIELVYVSVDPEARGQGIGQALLQAFQEASRAAGFKRVVAIQELDNTPSIALFASMGYRVKDEYREGQYDRQRVELIL
jgi:ribosomal protein S18 acetylase RimI-like enzyme